MEELDKFVKEYPYPYGMTVNICKQIGKSIYMLGIKYRGSLYSAYFCSVKKAIEYYLYKDNLMNSQYYNINYCDDGGYWHCNGVFSERNFVIMIEWIRLSKR